MTVKEAAKKWRMTQAMVCNYLRAGRVPGATGPIETGWTIPDGTPRPKPLPKGRPKASQVLG